MQEITKKYDKKCEGKTRNVTHALSMFLAAATDI